MEAVSNFIKRLSKTGPLTEPMAKVITGNSLKLVDHIDDNSIDLTVTSPPYCMGKEYESTSNVHDFIDSHFELLPKIIEKTKLGGNICWQIGYHVQDAVVMPLDFLVHEIMSQYPEVKLRNRIIWQFGHGTHSQHRFSGRHEVILWYSKGDEYYFDLDSVRVPQKYPGKKHYKGPKRGQFSGNPDGKNPSDVWDIPNVKSGHVEKTEHPCQFPIGLVLRLVNSLSPPNGLVFDPFVGSGTTAAACVLSGRSFLGFEKFSAYSRIARGRIKLAEAGNLQFRSTDIPIFDPRLAGSVGRKPAHFKTIL